MRYHNVGIKGSGSYLPSKIVTNYDIQKRVNTSHEWIYEKLGIAERRVAAENEFPSDLGYEAAKKALISASLEIEDIDLIIVATSSPEKISPSTACTIHSKFNTEKDIPSFDISAVCSGFVYAVNLAAPLISHGVYENVLIIGAETYSKITDWESQQCVFFGDGAGAIILGKTNKGWISCDTEANGKGTGMTGFSLPLNSNFIMKGKEVWDQATYVVPKTIRRVLEKSNLLIEDIDLIIPHQPSINILKTTADTLGISMTKIKTVMDRYGNIAGASIPIALDEAIKNSEFKEDGIILLAAIGSGWTWGSTIISYK